MSTPFEAAMENMLRGNSQRDQSKKLRELADKITKVPKSFNIPTEYIIGDK